MKGERTVAGLTCSQVLASLSDYLDGDLPAPERARLEAHVRACDHCARFGGVFATVVRALRTSLQAGEPPRGVVERVMERI